MNRLVIAFLAVITAGCSNFATSPTAYPSPSVAPSQTAASIPTPLRSPTPTTDTPPAPTFAYPPAVAPTRLTQLIDSEYSSCGAVSKDGHYMALQDWTDAPSSDPPQMFLWDVDEWAEAWRHEASNLCASMEFSRDGSLLGSGVYAMGKNAHIIVALVRAEEGRPEAGVVDFYHATDLAFSPDGDTLAVTDGDVLLYEIATMRRFVGNMLDDVGTDTPARILEPQSENDSVVAAEYSPTEPLLALSTSEGSLLLWPLEGASPSVSLSTEQSCREDPPESVRAIAFSGDGTIIATNLCGHGLALYDASTLTQAAAIPVPSPIMALAFAPGATRVLAGHEHGAFMWDLPTNSVACVLDTHNQSPVAVGFTRDGSRALATTREGAAIQWDLGTCGLE